MSNQGPMLLFDMNYMCYRSFHALRRFGGMDRGLGTVYGVLCDIVSLCDFFRAERCVFAFDSDGPGLRSKLLPEYKAARKERHKNDTEEDRINYSVFREQVQLLRDEYLSDIGFENVFVVDGYEADDIIASVAAAIPSGDEGIIITSDHDLYQCLRPNVWIWNPQMRKGLSLQAFKSEWGIGPELWASVKAYAGCSSDSIPGIRGVGERIASRFLRGTLPEHIKIAKTLRSDEAVSVFTRNIELVRLPFAGCPEFTIKPDDVTCDSWRRVVGGLGFSSLLAKYPRCAKAKKRGCRNAKKPRGLFV